MSEGEGLVVVKGVDDVGIGKGFEDEEILEAGPVRAGGDDGVLGGGLADGVDDGGFDALPAVRVVLLGLVHDLEEDVLGIDVGEVGSEGAPQGDEVGYAGCALEELGFVFAGGMNVEDDGEVVLEHEPDDAVELGHEGGFGTGALPGEERTRVD